MKIIKPTMAHAAYDYAADVFQEMYQKITGIMLPIITEDDGDDLIVIGSDAVNIVSAMLHTTGKGKFRCVSGSDSYHILSVSDSERKLLVLAGGRGRATIYAVYRFFEAFCGCRYFWDGDVIPKADSIPIEEIDLAEKPRFQYRGIRYFAHRSLHRFQAEHWGYEDWQREIDWLLKKRLNLFMLRIGNDDLFQRAFPDIVDYPSDTEAYEGGEMKGYNDRTSAWPLRYRGELRKKVLDYAFACDLMHPEDCGTMTHWYTRTPKQFLEKEEPQLLKQTSMDYRDQTGLVWDIRDDKNFENYFKLTETHIRDFGKPEIFHTIGLAERMYSEDRDTNMALKTYVYHRIAGKIAEDYPNAPLLIAGWDLMVNYTPEEVDKLLDTFDPTRTILFDYTADSCRDSNFTKWNTVGRFPWVFGIFHAFESDTEIRGLYPMIEERMKIAKEDPMCCGFILWPELSHSDTFMTEYVAANAWAPLELSTEERISKYCHDRYGIDGEAMVNIWKDFWPLVTLNAWSLENKGLSHKDIITDILFYMKFAPQTPYVSKNIEESEHFAENAARVLRGLIPYLETDNELLLRDVIDIARTVLKRYIQYGHRKIEVLYMRGESTIELCEKAETLVEILADMLGQYEEYSLYYSYKKLEMVHEVNPAFEKALLKNASNQYCRTQIYELIRHLFIPEQKLCFEMLHQAEKEGVHPDSLRAGYVEKAEENANLFINTKLEILKPDILEDKVSFVETLFEKAAVIIENMVL